MISYTILTSTPKALWDNLIEYGLVNDEKRAQGVEVVEVPNPDPDDPRHVFLVKLAHAAYERETEGKAQTEVKDGQVVEVAKIDQTAFGAAFKDAKGDFEIIEDAEGLYGVWQ